MMHSLLIRDEDGKVAWWACNGLKEGVFMLKADGTWNQLVGTGDAPRFRDARHFRRYLGRTFSGFEGARVLQTDW